MLHMAIFASGKGTNADNLCRYFKSHASVKISLILSDRKEAGVFEVAEKNNIEAIFLSSDLLKDPLYILNILRNHNIDFIVLAGYLRLFPSLIIDAYPERIINIHPALLPKYGGKGMFGMHVHEAVINSGDAVTGISIHYVNNNYDEGNIIFQASTAIEKTDSAQRIAEKIHMLEQEWLPKITEGLLKKIHPVSNR